jgi:nucleoid DNA-binding protein
MQFKQKAATAGVVLLLGTTGILYSQRPAPAPPGQTPPLLKALAAKTKVPLQTVQTVVDALGPEIRTLIQRGEVVTMPKLGTIRLVRVADHKDIERGTGRVLTVPARNYVTLDTDSEVDAAANALGVQPNEVVPQFQYNIMPGQTPSQKTGSLKVRSQRSP